VADLVSRLPFGLTARTATPAGAAYGLQDISYDVAIAGLPFLTAISDERPLTRGMAPVRKDQFDNQQIPGEQSLASWWLRSQSTFIGGAGVLYQDPSNDNQYAIRFFDSQGVNPWDNGRLTLLRKTTQRISDGTANKHLVLGWNDGTDRYWSAVGNTLRSDNGTATTAITWGGANTIRSLTSDGTAYYAADNVQVYKGTGNGAGVAWSATGTVNTVVRWVKGRIMLALDNKIYETTNAGVQTLRFTHLNTAWTWTDMCEGTNAIYAAGSAGSQSSIYKFVLSSTGDVPTLSTGGVLTAQLPLGEIVQSLTSYLGTFVGIGTSRGFRVGQIDDNGDIVYGPLLFTNTSGVKAVGAYDRFFFVAATNAINGQSGLYRVDLGQPIQDNGVSAGVRFAYATDLQALMSGEVSSVTNFGNSDRMVFTVVGQGSYLEHATDREATGWLKTGRTRFNTLEPKIFKFVTVKTPVSQFGSVGVSVVDPGGAETSIFSVSEGSSVSIENVIMAAPTAAVEWVQLKFTLGRSSGTPAQGGEMNGWQLKAMPGATRQRLFQIPLACFDEEKDRSGQRFGYEGMSRERLEAFEQIAQRGDAVSFQDLANDLSYLAVIDDYQFVQKANPGPNRTTNGGYLTVQLRTIADVVTS
jgi:hypothetical protein